MWSNYFHDLYSEQEDAENLFDENFYDDISSSVQTYLVSGGNNVIPALEEPIVIDEIKEQLLTVKQGKAPGPDNICNEHLIYGGDIILRYLCKLFNMILKTEYVPLSFRHGTIITLYKGNNKDRTLPNNYRAVTLTSVIGKLLEKIILHRIQNYLKNIDRTIPHPLQFGFVKEHGSIPAIYTLKESINFYLERDSTIYTAFLDNEKAFDRIWQNGLLYKLWNIGISGKIWRIIYDWYKTATANVQYKSLNSKIFNIEQGVGQGRVMSAWLFSLFINDLIYHLIDTQSGLLIEHLHIPCILLADDTTLLSSTKNGLQRLLNVVYNYAKNGD